MNEENMPLAVCDLLASDLNQLPVGSWCTYKKQLILSAFADLESARVWVSARGGELSDHEEVSDHKNETLFRITKVT
jgi:hypothetical protein